MFIFRGNQETEVRKIHHVLHCDIHNVWWTWNPRRKELLAVSTNNTLSMSKFYVYEAYAYTLLETWLY